MKMGYIRESSGQGAEQSTHYALEAEKIHTRLYKEAKGGVAKGKDPDIPKIYMCPVCGYAHVGTPPGKCPVCNMSSDKFRKF